MKKPSRLAALALGSNVRAGFRTGLLSVALLIAPAAQAATTQVTDPGPVPAGTVRINYYRPDGQYQDWGLHL